MDVSGVRSRRVRGLLDGLGFTTSGVRDRREGAACAGVDPELFYPVGTGPVIAAQQAAAKRVCARCPVRQCCLTDVMAWEDPALRWGVIGGLSPAERTELLQRRRHQLGRVLAEVA